ncbi:MAG: leucyl/phenylalanyl-tRNA--protein transferase [Gammaproteobacteria bacterium]|nr:leucyl/phenylalanyl-tRNA--protein transferase [Gammaproteobacteria bacterium]
MSERRIAWLSPDDFPDAFPDVETALREPNGLLAAGGDLSANRLLTAYRRGIFPWYDAGQPILWWAPDPRCVLRPQDLRISRRLAQYARQSTLSLEFNSAFGDVMRACAGKRRSQQGTWITAEMLNAYEQLHASGWAHSVEVWDGRQLVGGVYGVCIGRVFFGESMFSAIDNASKFALLGLCSHMLANGLKLLDCQVASRHLLTLGATMLPRQEFTALLADLCSPAASCANWPGDSLPVAESLHIWRSVALH